MLPHHIHSYVIKEELVDAFKNKPGFSRRVIFNILHKLKELNLISVKVDSATKRHHHLFVNRFDVLASLITVLEYFKKLYFELIHKTKLFIKRKGFAPVELVEYLIMLYKFTLYIINNLGASRAILGTIEGSAELISYSMRRKKLNNKNNRTRIHAVESVPFLI